MKLTEVDTLAFLQYRFWRSTVPAALIVGILLPPLYLLVMIQYGAITYPYWDHLTTAVEITQYFDGKLTLHDLLAPQQPSRPFFPRLIFVANAALTNWDVRSEFIYIYITIYGALAALLFALRQLSTDWPRIATLSVALLISIIACSPVGSQNHYWSLMLIATLCYFSSIMALVAVSVFPASWPANILAAIFSWVAAYSLGPGLFLFPTILLLHLIIAPRLFRFTRWSIFWLCNLIACYAVYFPGAPFTGSTTPTPFAFSAFVAVYFGNPLGGLLWFPHMGAIDIPHTTIINAICGVFLLGLAAFTAWRAWPELTARRPATLVFFAFTIFAAACAAVTAWGRASGPFAIIGANSSRYSLFAACLLFGLIAYYGAMFGRRRLAFTVWHKTALGIFVLASAVSYVRAVPVYRTAHNDNIWLADVYGARAEPTDLDTRAYPDFDYFNPKRADMLRLGIGPYRLIPSVTAQIFKGAFVAAVPLSPGTTVKQRFQPLHPMIRSITFSVVTWAKSPSSYRVRWKVVGGKNEAVLGEGSFATAGLTDWQPVTLELKGPSGDQEVEVIFSVENGESVQNPVGLALYPTGSGPPDPAIIDGHAREDGSKVGIRVRYAG